MSRDYVALKAAHRKKQGTQANAASQASSHPGAFEPIGMVVGLGNPGTEFEGTRHNIGFATVDELARLLGVSYWKSKPGALVAEVLWPHVFGAQVTLPNGSVDSAATEGPARIVLVKPQSFMNVSGGPVAHLAREYDVHPAGILVAHDDLEVDAGRIRVRIGGGHAGHNGLRSLGEKLGTRDFGRLRVGIGRPPGRMAPADFVLKQTRGREAEELALSASDAAAVALFAIEHGMEQACKRYA